MELHWKVLDMLCIAFTRLSHIFNRCVHLYSRSIRALLPHPLITNVCVYIT